ncbi:hypothetical protein G647_09593 [Cladophialophora carrionii CBS 160.54]|uniref:Uncharacterized protein n=1 Tax=Cladophialophora carrionii CBS 160.54 TaxID=1279043 RepID=V9DM57_9EURO|nr:uncharacterized protein G647_09593 [Cladophialophora carrionii CBS 160.54]ETI27403.1 hypothetical protein G647_09593 [Cladophialophora carrionii CBS 160.54]
MSEVTLLQTQAALSEIPSSSGIDNEANGLEPVDNASQRHPLGVKPSGNELTLDASQPSAQAFMGFFGRLPGALLLEVLEYLDSQDLVAMGSTCRGLYAYSAHDRLWRDIVVNNTTRDFEWRGSFRASLRGLPSAKLANIDCSSLFSDALYQPFLCSQIPLTPYVSNIPRQNEIARLADLSPAQFNDLWVDKPFILTQPVKTWKIFESWNDAYLLSKYGRISFVCESITWPFEKYVKYMNTTQDESPLYLFDQGFVEKMGLQVESKDPTVHNAYEPPLVFQEDLFTLLKEQRPDHRWLIIGPKYSGSTFHKDPNATSAWNAVIRGSKYWIMFPNSVLPPGVYMSEDQSEVTSPLSIAEWLLGFHAEARQTIGCVEGICREGEVLHVPSGWWHLVVNLEPAIAITQNFVPRAHVRSAIRFLREKPDQVSGFKDDVTDPYGLFIERLRQSYPDLAASLDERENRKRKWEEVVADQGNADGERQGFSFGFGDDIDEEDTE